MHGLIPSLHILMHVLIAAVLIDELTMFHNTMSSIQTTGDGSKTTITRRSDCRINIYIYVYLSKRTELEQTTPESQTSAHQPAR